MSKPLNPDVDILIIGGGVVGAILLLTLRNSGYKVRLVEGNRHDTPISFDARSIALANSSVNLLENLAINPQYTNINRINISEKGVFGVADLTDPRSLGRIVELPNLQQAIVDRLANDESLCSAKCTFYDTETQTATLQYSDNTTSTCSTNILVAADGSNSSIRDYLQLTTNITHYDNSALVANIELARPHNGVAYERFTKTGPLAFLPLSDKRVAMVWSLPQDLAQAWQHTSEQEFLQQLYKTFGYRLGRFIKLGRRSYYPLKQSIMSQIVKDNVVFIGNAAQTLHPVAGQGLNLGLRDVACLAQYLVQYGANTDALMHYKEARTEDRALISNATETLVKLFTKQHTCYKILRGIGLLTLANSTIAQQILIRNASGFGSIVPNLMCGLPLEIK